jgi:hypothetical protein
VPAIAGIFETAGFRVSVFGNIGESLQEVHRAAYMGKGERFQDAFRREARQSWSELPFMGMASGLKVSIFGTQLRLRCKVRRRDGWIRTLGTRISSNVGLGRRCLSRTTRTKSLEKS